MEYIPTTTQQRILCCECGVPMAPNAANMCVDCIRSRVDITEGIPKQCTIHFCRFCDRYLQPPNQWLTCQLESRELMALCLKRLKGLTKVRLIDAGFVWTEPNSRRLKIKLTIQQEVFSSTILQQVFVVEFIVAHQMCDDCRRVEAKDTWKAVVQVRQKVPHKRTFLFLEQLLLKHNMHRECINIKECHEGLDFFFATRNQAIKLQDFLQANLPVRTKSSEELISADIHTSTYNYKFTFSVELVPICKDDLVCLPAKVRKSYGSINPLVICTRIGSSLQFIDPLTLHHIEMSAAIYWRHPFTSLCSTKRLTNFAVLDTDFIKSDRHFALADIQLQTEGDFGVNDNMVICKTHLGHVLKPGDYVSGYDLRTSNVNNEDFEKLDARVLPDVILIKKIYSDRGRKRRWKLKRANIQKTDNNESKKKDDQELDDYEEFLQDLETDKELRAGINLYKDPNAPDAMSEMNDDDDDAPGVDVDELLDEFDEMDIHDEGGPDEDNE